MKNKTKCYRPHRPCCHGLGFATLLIIAGALLLCSKLNIIPAKYSDVLISWQMLLIALGVISLVRRRFYSAIVLVSIGSFFLIPEIGLVPDNFIGTIPPNFIHMYWPVLLIIAGVLFFLHRIFPPKRRYKIMEAQFRHHADMQERYHRHKQSHNWDSENGYIEKNSAFNSSEHIVLDPEFKGGEINTAFGETKLDLRKTQLPEGKTKLEINVVFGAITIYVPADWNVQLNVNAVFGSFEDKRTFQDTDPDSSKTLVIYGSVVFGGGELRN